MFKLELSQEEMNAIYTFLQRSDLKGGEAKMMAILQVKIEQSSQNQIQPEENKEPSKEEKQPKPEENKESSKK